MDGEMIIVDEFTGRLMPGRNWSDGLHQAVEAKEGVRVKEENQTLATITLQNFFKLYDKICGMTGTAMTEAGEFWKIYKLDVIAVPTNKPLRRLNHPDVIYRSEREKFDRHRRRDRADAQVGRPVDLKDETELLGTIDARERRGGRVPAQGQQASARRSPATRSSRSSAEGRPILVGTVSIEKSERLSACWTGAASSTRCSTPSITSARPRSWPRPAARTP